MNPDQRQAYRNSLPKFSIWDFSSDSDVEPLPEKKPKHSPVEGPGFTKTSRSPSPDTFRATQKSEVQSLTPSLLSHLGYMNRNVRPPHSRKNNILPSSETSKADYSSIVLEHSKKEQKKIENFKAMINKS
jgi:hypothetical protein